MATLNDVLWGKQITYTPNHPEGRSGSQRALEELLILSASRRHSLLDLCTLSPQGIPQYFYSCLLK